MLDKAEIRKEIARLEYEESSYPNYAKLANLYTIRKQMQEEEQGTRNIATFAYSGDPAPAPASEQPETISEYGDSDFLRTVAGKDPARVWPIMDELMDTVLLVKRSVYDSVMRKISDTR